MTQPLPQPTGSSWGQDRAGEQPAAQPEATAARPWFKKKRFLIPGGLVALLLVVGGVMGQGGDADPTASSPVETAEVVEATSDATEDAARVEAKEAAAEDAARVQAEQAAAEQAAAEEAVQIEAEEAERAEAEESARTEAERAEVEAAEAATAGTVSQQNAMRSAEDYLDFGAFSRGGLIEQLEYEQFSTEDATWAVDRVSVDWNEQAAMSAEDYLDFGAFSRGGLIEQLIYEGFTPEQAEYGVNQTGL